MHAVSLYWHTIRYLRPVQIGARLWRKISRPSFVPPPALTVRMQNGPWMVPARRLPSMLGDMTFSFLNETRSIETADWAGADAPSLLWRYNLHYFDDLNALDASSRRTWHRTAMRRWLAENPPGTAPAWDPYPTSLRIVNWIKAALSGFPFDNAAVESLAMQAGVLSQSLEYHLLGNHLFANAKALVFAGLFFEGDAADRWLDKGMSILARQIPEQILADGGHFERSPMYHALALEDMLDLINLTKVFSDEIDLPWRREINAWRSRASRMYRWLSVMSHPDGEFSLFNDAAFGIASSRTELERYAIALLDDVAVIRSHSPANADVTLTELSPSGYLRADCSNAALFLDVAPIGPDYLPGHAHADTLSFELSVFGHRVLVNTGTSVYGTGLERQRQRGTAAHNTVIVDGADSSEVWGGFRVARRARPFGLTLVRDEHSVTISCSHDGYRRLKGSPVHRRTWRLRAEGLRVEDRIAGHCRSAEARFHFHPAVRCMLDVSRLAGLITLPSGRTISWRACGGQAKLVNTTYHPEFGASVPNTCLIVPLAENAATIDFAW